MTPIVITSRKARNELNRMKAHALNILKEYEEHKKKIASYHEGKRIENETKAKAEADRKAKDMAEIQAHVKEIMAQRLKEKELALKHIALNGND